MSDTFSILDSKGDPFAGGAHILENATILKRNRIVIKDKDGKPVYLAIQEVVTINKKYDVYGLGCFRRERRWNRLLPVVPRPRYRFDQLRVLVPYLTRLER
jgi:uncharacterized protein YxjI